MARGSERARPLGVEYAVDHRRLLLIRARRLPERTLLLAAAAAVRLDHAYEWGHRGDAPAPGAREACEAARAPAKRRCGLVGPDEAPFSYASVPAVDPAQMGALVALAVLCVEAAGRLAREAHPGKLSVQCLSRPCEPIPDWPAAAPFAGVLAARLDQAHLLELEIRESLVALLAALVAQRPDLTPWIPLDRDPTVRVREPAGHPGLPLVVTPFVMESEAAWEAVRRRAVVHDAFVAATPALDALWRTRCVRT